ncbi:unnamed protein product [Didymodactylos carnosus]|uniref:Protein kinase domain-containing protein n=1 Tax=Didymodactylos carnosus TaxID=1234261 RepID=A0A8S2DT28_9BILA|nr:unnamed protein product [Didymodactylos carnosus]CAF3762351.1 unnamed protein product [Didymodactylos carnosus]
MADKSEPLIERVEKLGDGGFGVVYIGTDAWLAPELCLDRPERSSFPSDVWAFGCILLEVISKKTPWKDQYQNDRVLLNALAKPENAIIFENICPTQRAPKKLRTILCRCCAWQKAVRPKFSTITSDLSSISEADLLNINCGQEKSLLSGSSNLQPSTVITGRPTITSSSSAPKAYTNDLDNVEKSLAQIKLKSLKAQRLSSASRQTGETEGRSANEDRIVTYDKDNARCIYEGPRGGLYYFNSSGRKVYTKHDFK